MTNFNFYVPLVKSAEQGETQYLQGTASTLDVDRDVEKMSAKALNKMQAEVTQNKINLFGNHEHSWENTLGVVESCNVTNKTFDVKIALDDAKTNPKIPSLLGKISRGINLGLSVGGKVLATYDEFDKNLNKTVTVIDDLELYELSVVGIPSNKATSLSITNQIAKSLKIDAKPAAQEGEIVSKKHSDKWGRCVEHVRAQGNVESPEAVCTAALGEESYKSDSAELSEMDLQKIDEKINEMLPKKKAKIKFLKGELIMPKPKIKFLKGTVLEERAEPPITTETKVGTDNSQLFSADVCPMCGSTNTTLLDSSGGTDVHYCEGCQTRYSRQRLSTSAGSPLAQPVRSTGRGVGAPMNDYPSKR